MRIASVELSDFQGFASSGKIVLGPITVLVGPNNSGKSSIVRALSLLHPDLMRPSRSWTRIGAETARVRVEIEEPDMRHFPTINQSVDSPIEFVLNGINWTATLAPPEGAGSASPRSVAWQTPSRPDNFIEPFFSRRKASSVSEEVKEQTAQAVYRDFQNLHARVDARLDSPYGPAFRERIRAVTGGSLGLRQSANGKRLVQWLAPDAAVPIEEVGEGMLQLLGLLLALDESAQRLFLIEEPEDDLHPKALRSLLELILASSGRNQFVITTHSHIVVTTLAGKPAHKLYAVETSEDDGSNLPTSTLRGIVSASERHELLIDLGYQLYDLDMWEGWLICEESSAERIIRDYLIPWFAPTLSRLRTYAAGGAGKVRRAAEDLTRQLVFVYLQSVYRESTWVLVDGGETGRDLVEDLRKHFTDWPAAHFIALAEADFEAYYPSAFADRASEVLAMPHSTRDETSARREAKRVLLGEVIAWIGEDAPRAEREFETCAAEVIGHLRGIETAIAGR